MKIIQPSFEIVSPQTPTQGESMLRCIEKCARYSHRAEDQQTNESWRRFIKAVVVDKGDWSVTEHVSATVIARVDRGVSHEWVRHRIGAYTQESTRFVNYGKKDAEGNYVHELEFVEPVFTPGQDAAPLRWKASVRDAEINYHELLESGQTPQIARSILPNATATSLVVTYNLRNWRHFFIMRTTQETHPDFKRITIPMLEEFKKRIPLLYDDIVPEEKQRTALSRPR